MSSLLLPAGNQLLPMLHFAHRGGQGSRAEKQKVQRSDLLRQQLIALRESEIKPTFPESPLENGLLPNSLLDEFVQMRPKTRDDWFRKIPHHLRVSVDSKQVGKYLDRVLAIIAESEGGGSARWLLCWHVFGIRTDAAKLVTWSCPLFISQRYCRLDAHGPARWKVTGESTSHEQYNRCQAEGSDVGRIYAE